MPVQEMRCTKAPFGPIMYSINIECVQLPCRIPHLCVF